MAADVVEILVKVPEARVPRLVERIGDTLLAALNELTASSDDVDDKPELGSLATDLESTWCVGCSTAGRGSRARVRRWIPSRSCYRAIPMPRASAAGSTRPWPRRRMRPRRRRPGPPPP